MIVGKGDGHSDPAIPSSVGTEPLVPRKGREKNETSDFARHTNVENLAKRTVSADFGLMSKEQLIANYTGSKTKPFGRFMPAEDATCKSKVTVALAKVRGKVDSILDYGRISITYSDAMAVVIAFVLFGDDIRLLFCPPKADIVFSVFYSIAFFLFILEIPFRSWARSNFSNGIMNIDGYFLSLYFWLDLCATITIIPFMPWLSAGLGIKQTIVLTKRGLLLKRSCRMIRLVRVVNLYKTTPSRVKDKNMLNDLEILFEHDRPLDQNEIAKYFERKKSLQKKSIVGARLSEIITRKVIITVLLIVIIVPILSYPSVNQDEKNATAALQFVNENSANTNSTNCEYLIGSATAFKSFFLAGDHELLLALEVGPSRCNSSELISFENGKLIQQLRPEAIEIVSTPKVNIDGNEYYTTAVFNLQHELERTCKSSIYLTLFLIFVLRALSSLSNNDARELILTPLEEMVQMVNRVASDPLADLSSKDSVVTEGPHEIQVVRLAIQKITSLLRVGFGVAGAEIISSNMDVEGDEGTVFKPMIPGSRIYAIFGFCDIHAFDLYTERLEDEIMAFVNSVARIVHEEVTRWGGHCNKNLGNAFLMVWRIGDEDGLKTATGKTRRQSAAKVMVNSKKSRSAFAEVDLKRMPGESYTSMIWSDMIDHSDRVRSLIFLTSLRTVLEISASTGLDVLSDKALIGFLKVIVEINRDRQVLSYRRNKRLSPHVNMAARMEAASRQFGLSILMTERFHELLSPEAQRYCRKVDVVTVKGSNIPMPIYTYETMQNQIFPALQVPKFSGLDLKTVLSQQALDYTPLDWTQDPDLVQLRIQSTLAFRTAFDGGLQCYLSGQWYQARTLLEQADLLMSGNDSGFDGPSRVLLQYMRARDWICPEGW
eukprot:CAMPEP_0172437614 /NCGR_PEP_ID=MMETSP1064-20121228/72353_1 /TAXON_ID=202472 /ORGANISM="Aulacoseira subarctica , Strain CCAP 1002/5" /LENGTH=885 /DNA_ID=CAMNT_0013186105 /DNA_START=2352 /DNA_END=5007 /DNA_ORIENTATION=+